jgi:hypothetical protein
MHTIRSSLRLSLVLLVAAPAAASADDLFKTDRFRGSVPGITIRDVASGGRPWILKSIQARLEAPKGDETTATLKVDVKGLVFPPGTVINGEDVGGTRGGVTHFAATLSCIDALGATVNVTTGGFETTLDGDADIRERITVPAVCYAAVLLVRSFNPTAGTAGNWFAASGF